MDDERIDAGAAIEALAAKLNETEQQLAEVTRERDASSAAYECVVEAVTPGRVGGAEATALMAKMLHQDCTKLRAERDRYREERREACDRLRAVSGAKNDGPKNLLDYVADIERALTPPTGGTDGT